MKNISIIDLTVFLALVLSPAAMVTETQACICDYLHIVATGKVSWFCCLVPDIGAKVTLVGSKGQTYGKAVTGAAGRYRIAAAIKRVKCNSSPKCCVFADTIHVRAYHCFKGVVGIRGRSHTASALALDACIKGIRLTMSGICEDFSPCFN